MNGAFRSILLPLDGSAAAARGLGCAVWLAERLGARLHLLSAGGPELPARAALARLQVPERCWEAVELHQVRDHPETAILEAAARHDAQLIIVSARGEGAEEEDEAGPVKIVGHVTRAVIERSAVPVLVLPPGYRERLPWERLLVPLSGEAETDAVLALAVRLANALGLNVHVAHVADAEAAGKGLEIEARYADALHHEYAGRLEALLHRTLPQCTPEECRCIEDVALCRGDVAAELLDLIEGKQISVLVAGWHGRFVTDHAAALKQLLPRMTCPALLVKPRPPRPFELKVGEAIE